MPVVPRVVFQTPTQLARRQRRRPFLALLFSILGGLGFRWRSSVAEVSPSGKTAVVQPDQECSELAATTLTTMTLQLIGWQKSAAAGRIVPRFAVRSARLLNGTMAIFETGAAKLRAAPCAAARDALEIALRQRIGALFKTQLTSVEEMVRRRLRADLLRGMRRRRAEVPVQEKLRLFHLSVDDYDSRAAKLQPFFVNCSSDRAEAVQRLSELQWSIGDTAEAMEMKQRWRMDKMMSAGSKRRGPSAVSMSFSPGLRVLLRPRGLGNLQVVSKRQIGPPHNPNEVVVGIFNDGDVADVYNRKPRPSFLKVQPVVGLEFKVR